MKKLFLILFTVSSVSVKLLAQSPQIVYSEPEREDSRRTNFEIIGKVGANFLVYKNNSTQHDICVYDNNMKLKDRVKTEELTDDRVINIDFISYPDYCYAIYQHQKRGVVYCNAIKINENGKMDGKPLLLDTTQISFAANNKIYTTVFSDDKQKIMVFKINNRNQLHFFFTTMLFDNKLLLQKKDRLVIEMEERNDFFTDFSLSNDGDLVFGKFKRSSINAESIVEVDMVIKYADSSNFSITDIKMGSRILDEIKLKIDNTNKRILLSALFFKQKRGNIDGLYLLKWDKSNNQKLGDTAFVFTDEFREKARGEDVNKKLAFNDYYLKNVFIRKDGGFVLVGESLYTTSRGGMYNNRWDYSSYGNPWASSYNYYSPYYSPWGMPWDRYGSTSSNSYHADNIMIVSFSKSGALEWSNVITKSQRNDESDNMISYITVNTGGMVHFLFNVEERRSTSILNDQTVSADGAISRSSTLKNLDKGYEFMPRLGKQVSAKQLIVPCLYRNYLCFAKVEF